ncbi:Hypothetical protein NTJ_00807 [Nesidiocoris tenuis]|uniref:Uncharacterized protein n=1 Tax=Nesidiocoris tenuis TaxID=355587 RepID=A0ABN7A709_9HEMI|nr:Hypothetical protein NTJ_00807 [Nesidiocoris tenuis]
MRSEEYNDPEKRRETQKVIRLTFMLMFAVGPHPKRPQAVAGEIKRNYPNERLCGGCLFGCFESVENLRSDSQKCSK